MTHPTELGQPTGSAPTAQAEPAIRDFMRQRPGAIHDRRLDWFRNAKFGMFVHWGLYALPAGEWQGEPIAKLGEWIMKRGEIPVAEYEPLAARFDPIGFDAAQWVGLAKAAGQRYITVTAKHHDGFCLFATKLTDYNIVDATPFGRDPMQELAAECEKQGIRLCFYYSQTQDWHHPGADGNDWDFAEPDDEAFDGYIQDYVKPQVRELLTNYGDIGLIWFDTPRRITAEQSRQLVELVHEIQPDCLVNGRIGNGMGDYASAADGVIPGGAVAADWETPMTMNQSWGYVSRDHSWKSSKDLVHQLIDSASKGGNYLLNVGPTAAGVIPSASEERLRAVGHWLARNGEAIYGTRRGPIQGTPHYRSTVKGDTIYLHVLDWPPDGRIDLPHPDVAIERASVLGGQTPLGVRADAGRLVIETAGCVPDSIATVIALTTSPTG